VPKTLIFAKDDSHADDIVQIAREVFGKGNEFAQKITYKTWMTGQRPEDLLASFRNSYFPRIAVTVDMIATGTDVRPLEIVMFMRAVRSRNYFEQMKDFRATGVPVLNVGCVQWEHIAEHQLNFLPPTTAARFRRYTIEPGDVVFTRSGTVGRCAVAKDHHAGWLMTFHLLRVRPDPLRCLPEYLRIVFEGAPHIRRQTREASIGTTRAGFNTNLLAALDVPLPSSDEQRRIVAEVDRRVSLVDELGAVVDANLKRAERLRQAILRRAFEGKLVPQDPREESASVLLERIRLEREARGRPSGGGNEAARARSRRGRIGVQRIGRDGEGGRRVARASNRRASQ